MNRRKKCISSPWSLVVKGLLKIRVSSSIFTKNMGRWMQAKCCCNAEWATRGRWLATSYTTSCYLEKVLFVILSRTFKIKHLGSAKTCRGMNRNTVRCALCKTNQEISCRGYDLKKKWRGKKNLEKKNIKTMKRYPWRLPASRLFGFQSILSVCGATRTLCGRLSIYRSVGRVTLGLNCKQVTSKDHGWPSGAHPRPSDSSFFKEAESRLLNSCTIKPQ